MNHVTADAADRGRCSIVQARVDGDDIVIRWGDGHESLFPAIWLRHTCICPECGSTETARRSLRLTDIPATLAADRVKVVDAGIEVSWRPEEHVSRYDAMWLRAHCLSDKERERRRHKPTLWNPLTRGVIEYDSLPALESAPARLRFLERIRDYGFVILNDVTCDPDATEKVAKLVGILRATNYGIYELISQPNPQLVGDTAVALAPHTDEPYRHNPPGITFFHVLAQSAEGGDSTLVDGYYVANLLRERDPKAFDLLSTVPASFHRVLKEGRAFLASAPVIGLDVEGNVTSIRLLDRGTAPLDMPAHVVRPYYDALRTLLQYLYDEKNQLIVKIGAGQMLVFNNQRLLHGRTAFDPKVSHRHVRSCNVDLDEFYSSLRVAYRALGREEAYMNLGQAGGA